ncbi:SDR family oxidoreductase [Nocardia sp. BMG111209]|uniref:SDR family oxidoreductase n=1 Tax=Nocardia sp. BMG111209 TaxID=1160137 RepID=UPI000371A950|nr:NAD(P)H-binding protein [Nocardia sp. BMG111209]
MSATILITGGTGVLGSRVVPLLQDKGYALRVLSRHTRDSTDGVEYVACDLLKDEGIDRAVAGVEIILHLAGSTKGDDVATRNLVAAAQRAGVRHMVYISVIGADKVPLAWFRSKRGAEQAIVDSGIEWTILRAAQFHELTLKTIAMMAKMPIVPAPGVRMQPVDSGDVAARIAELTLAAPAGLVADIAGPTEYAMADLIRGYLHATGKRRPILSFGMPGKAGKAYRAGDNLALADATIGHGTWEDFLATH